jgi:hypothetical protein
MLQFGGFLRIVANGWGGGSVWRLELSSSRCQENDKLKLNINNNEGNQMLLTPC